MATLDEPGLCQVGECSTHRDAGDPELIAQRLLRGQCVARGECAAGDLVMEDQEQLAVKCHARSGIDHRGDVPTFLHGKSIAQRLPTDLPRSASTSTRQSRPVPPAQASGTSRSISSSQTLADMSDGARQSPRGDSAPPEDTLGPLGSAERLNWLNE